MLVVNNVTKSYGNFSVLKNINLELVNGVYGLLAPNGAGKTTLIKMLTTLIFPNEGEILYNGTDIVKMDDEYRDILGYLPQEFGYYKNYSPKQYLLYLAALKGIDNNAAKKRIEELLKLVALEDVANKKMRKFSGGMIQRVGIAQAMLNDPKILILDEPTAGLDPKERVRFRNLLTELSRDRIVILSTHIVSDVESIANEIIMIKDKKILYKDSINNICKNIQGMVYETEIDFDAASNFRKQYFSLSEKQEEGKMKVRFIYKGKPDSAWKPVTPSLEDVFLYEYRDESLERV
ncbi:ABC transporter family protein [Clostridium argentinense CDC 2741]|uniref:ABC transporter family protein n=1 Tax=Clostridium argentinense CDC 2741 TaxID=1418104 RepID=A0A0C1U1S1_9CLOT|nr:ABC transporter ATP-binding protein [Clostridium argentinense]ARC86689.1 multidrug ABC transporter ATP-binding protein [Clostridium argentinense]KIE45438.1 ABC transporter family protein [Clostridium argentinense CDC 2741]NFF38430.1 ABC transporter ATP-binding protein [Clostridium argentinense]NFP49376.1 ABC transporter ATP-binding protein [Clostridium argentinense]NFP71779.1 ABC transporter ATP-binding protein [Clostridium argentinense]